MEERLFFNRVDIFRDEAAPCMGVKRAALVLPDPAYSPVAVPDMAAERAKAAVCAATCRLFVQSCFSHLFTLSFQVAGG